MKSNSLTYQKSGVNIKAADKFIDYISYKLRKSKKNSNFTNIGGFGAISKIPVKGGIPYLVTSTDGVGTKLELANDLKKFDTIGIDLVAMSVNDLIVQGAKPLIFLDYISIDKINLKKLKQIINGIINGCKIAGCDLAGGETAEMPGTYSKDKFDLAGFAIGLVDKDKILKKEKIKNGDIIMAIPSSGIHSNGYSLVRKVLKKRKINIKKNSFLKKELLRATKIYVKEINSLCNQKLLNACANITGGGISDNIKRILPNNLSALINLKNIKIPKIFKWLKNQGISDEEMLKTFNCGVGFCIIVKKKNISKVKKYFSIKFRPYIIGKIIKKNRSVILNEKLLW